MLPFLCFLTPLPAVQFVMAEVVRFLLKVLNDFVRWVEQLPNASLDGIWLYRLEVLGIYISCCCFSFIIRRPEGSGIWLFAFPACCVWAFITRSCAGMTVLARALYFTMFVVVRRFIVLLRMGLLG